VRSSTFLCLTQNPGEDRRRNSLQNGPIPPHNLKVIYLQVVVKGLQGQATSQEHTREQGPGKGNSAVAVESNSSSAQSKQNGTSGGMSLNGLIGRILKYNNSLGRYIVRLAVPGEGRSPARVDSLAKIGGDSKLRAGKLNNLQQGGVSSFKEKMVALKRINLDIISPSN